MPLAIGEAVNKALGDRVGIKRFGQALSAMDETLSRVVVDCSNRPYLIWKVKMTKPKLGEMDTELFKEWFQAFAQTAGITLHVETLYGENNHHIIESCYKGLARALRESLAIDEERSSEIPSTKKVNYKFIMLDYIILEKKKDNLEVVETGFSYFALLYGPLWAAYHSLWLAFFSGLITLFFLY